MGLKLMHRQRSVSMLGCGSVEAEGLQDHGQIHGRKQLVPKACPHSLCFQVQTALLLATITLIYKVKILKQGFETEHVLASLLLPICCVPDAGDQILGGHEMLDMAGISSSEGHLNVRIEFWQLWA